MSETGSGKTLNDSCVILSIAIKLLFSRVGQYLILLNNLVWYGILVITWYN